MSRMAWLNDGDKFGILDPGAVSIVRQPGTTQKDSLPYLAGNSCKKSEARTALKLFPSPAYGKNMVRQPVTDGISRILCLERWNRRMLQTGADDE